MGLAIEGDRLRSEALRWALFKGQRSGRSRRQFMDDLAAVWPWKRAAKTRKTPSGRHDINPSQNPPRAFILSLTRTRSVSISARALSQWRLS